MQTSKISLIICKTHFTPLSESAFQLLCEHFPSPATQVKRGSDTAFSLPQIFVNCVLLQARGTLPPQTYLQMLTPGLSLDCRFCLSKTSIAFQTQALRPVVLSSKTGQWYHNRQNQL